MKEGPILRSSFAEKSDVIVEYADSPWEVRVRAERHSSTSRHPMCILSETDVSRKSLKGDVSFR